jgi:RecJ-like exonuclease
MDRRDRNHAYYTNFDERAMTFCVGDEADIPVVYEVCGTCEGQGSHVNPAIDAHGISIEEFAEDPDFMEAYLRGDYDIPCNECHGRRVVPVVDPNRATEEQKRHVEDYIEGIREMEACYEAERRMGA